MRPVKLRTIVRGFQPTNSTKGLIDMSGPTDSRAPQLNTLFGDKRTPQFSAVYRANNWDWGSNSRGSAISDFEVTVAGLAVAPGEIIRVPRAGYEIGQGYAAIVLYASRERITLKYTGEDSVVSGYAIHVDGVCVDMTAKHGLTIFSHFEKGCACIARNGI